MSTYVIITLCMCVCVFAHVFMTHYNLFLDLLGMSNCVCLRYVCVCTRILYLCVGPTDVK